MEKTLRISSMGRALRRSEREGDHECVVLGQRFLVKQGVFSPAYYSETAFYASLVLDQIRPGDRYLDIGCGVGVTAVMAAQEGAAVTAVDINPRAVANTRLNARRHGVSPKVRAMWSDVYSSLKASETFDLIYWNVPFAYRDPGTELSLIEEAIFDPGYEKHRRFLSGATQHLGSGGRLLMGVSSTLGENSVIQHYAHEAGLDFVEIGEELEDSADDSIELQLLMAVS